MSKITEHFVRFKLLAAKLNLETEVFLEDNHVSELKDPAVFLAIENLRESTKKTIKAISENLDFKVPEKP